MDLRTIKEAVVKDKRVFIRCGFDVPFDDQGKIIDDERIKECIPTLKYLHNQGAKLIIGSHNGRPKGRIVPKLSMDTVKDRLEKLLGCKIKKVGDCIGIQVAREIAQMGPDEIILLENLRFHIEEERNDPEFANQLASLAEIYVNEAFANSHRDHASMTGVTQHLIGYAGFRLLEEVATLSKVMKEPARPLVAIIGGVKISDKIQVIKRFLEVADHVLIGGALANTILKAQGISIGRSITEDDLNVAKELPLTNTRLHVPVDVVVASEISPSTPTQNKAAGNVADEEYILDIGPDTIGLYEMIINKAKTIVWGGPMGYFEYEQFARGTTQIARAICKSQSMSVAGGGDTMEALDRAKCKDKISFVSTGGGAMLHFLEGKMLPAIKPLIKK